MPIEQLDAHLQLGLELGPMLRIDRGQVLLPDVQPSQERQRDDSPSGMNRQQPEHHPDVAVDMRRTRRPRSRVVMDSGPLDERPIALRRRVVECQGELARPATKGLTTAQTRRAAMSLAFLPAAATVV